MNVMSPRIGGYGGTRVLFTGAPPKIILTILAHASCGCCRGERD